MSRVFKLHHKIPSYEADLTDHWKLSAVFSEITEAANGHVVELGAGRHDLAKKNLFWALVRMRLDMYEYPKEYEEVILSTWYDQPASVTFGRYFSFDRPDGTPICAAASLWVTADKNSRKIIRPCDTGLDFHEPADIKSKVEPPTKPRFDGAPTRISERAAAYSDFDVNAHFNNARYIEWICDLFPIEWHVNNHIRTITISYLNEITTSGQRLRLELSDGDTFFVRARDAQTGIAVFEAAGAFEPRAGK